MKLALNEIKIKAKIALKKERVEESSKQLKHYLQEVSMSMGFNSWQHASELLSGKCKSPESADFGTFFHAPACDSLINHWFSSYSEAREIHLLRQESYLLPYKRHFVVAGSGYLTAIGLNQQVLDEFPSMNLDFVQSYGTAEWDKLSLTIIRSRS
ncbi:hypothetical protein EYS14_06080 [Alteromonadaceae bacterium M269]|nr:hypothetical protein EYS14_06080 [Alteromonadaceae bacterium M269]